MWGGGGGEEVVSEGVRGGRDIACTLVSCHVSAVFCGATVCRAAEST